MYLTAAGCRSRALLGRGRQDAEALRVDGRRRARDLVLLVEDALALPVVERDPAAAVAPAREGARRWPLRCGGGRRGAAARTGPSSRRPCGETGARAQRRRRRPLEPGAGGGRRAGVPESRRSAHPLPPRTWREAARLVVVAVHVGPQALSLAASSALGPRRGRRSLAAGSLIAGSLARTRPVAAEGLCAVVVVLLSVGGS